MEENHKQTDEEKIVAILDALTKTADTEEKREKLECVKQKVLVRIDVPEGRN